MPCCQAGILVLSQNKRQGLAAVWRHAVFPVTPVPPTAVASSWSLPSASSAQRCGQASWCSSQEASPGHGISFSELSLSMKGLLPLILCTPSGPQAQRNSSSPNGSTPPLLPQRLLRLVFSVRDPRNPLLTRHPAWGLLVVVMGDGCQCSKAYWLA